MNQITHLIKTFTPAIIPAGRSRPKLKAGSVVVLAIALAFLGAGTVNAKATALGIPEGESSFRCNVALMLPSRQLTVATPVDISFARHGANIENIRVVDKGGILYPGGNFKIEKNGGAVKFGGVPMPPERPGKWTGVVEKKLLRFVLKSEELAQAVGMVMGVAPDRKTGHFGLVWNATNTVSGLPQPLSGSGIGICDPVVLDQAK